MRDFFHLGLAKKVVDRLDNADVAVASPSAGYGWFDEEVRRYFGDEAEIFRAEAPVNVNRPRLSALRKRLPEGPGSVIAKSLIRQEARGGDPLEDLRAWSPTHVVLNHPLTSHEEPLFHFATRESVRTLGIVKSWDNLGKKLQCLPQRLSVWSDLDRSRAVQKNGYRSADVAVNGAVGFDHYMGSCLITKNQLAAKLRFSPQSCIVTYATLGQFSMGYYGRDETEVLEDLLEALSGFEDFVVVVRLHPASRLEDFQFYMNNPSVRFSHGGYRPGVGWYLDRAGIEEQHGLLSHSDLMVTPGSSWAIEAAICKTPVLMPVYSTLQPQHARAQFDSWHLATHFKPIAELDLLPILRSREDFMDHVRDVMAGRLSVKEDLERLGNLIGGPLGGAGDSVADWLLREIAR